MEDEFLGIKFPCFPQDLTRSGIKQNVFVPERKKIRALPHFAGIHWIDIFLFGPVAGNERMQIFPTAQILRTVEKHLATLLELSGGNAEIPCCAVLPQKRI